ncbi:DEAD/DEAH box helicase [Ligilactobacillus sp. WILCCON 0076]|uniref:DEAD/DEAH box helicase n=1 Tax=Ligilactobacillus ubinensis TaxID=2876789 RepID=A0A9X2FI16_9LACO|nr:DEAD/DEAH box helicase [Ligilactobacillus ubinensis]MCP0886367.1 DEAD/DEAH box helicase [Ligilactobacillus ubinensis]
MDEEFLYGRQLPETVISHNLRNAPNIEKRPAVLKRGKYIYCQRCGNKTVRDEVALPSQRYYCPHCILLGRVATHNLLYSIPEPHHFLKITSSPLTWQGTLSKLQAICSSELLEVAQTGGKHLMWAVTGAGKTEMLFETIAWALQKGRRIALASPRVDVCNELYPRFKQAFNNIDIILLHGKQNEKYRYTQLVICTTHQLLRFFRAFDILIIDEVDAFPFVGDKGLAYAADNALTEKGTLIYLTATPSRKLLQQIRKKQLTVSYLPLRFHGYLLPEPIIILDSQLKVFKKKNKLSRKIIKIIKRWESEGYQFLIFVPKISLLEPVYQSVKKILKHDTTGTTVFSGDIQRIKKVSDMRKLKYRYLITTTILERGVTFPALNILILKADDTNFTVSALVQIAGRVGRSFKRPEGDIYFACSEYSRNVKAAVAQIKFLNKKGSKVQK